MLSRMLRSGAEKDHLRVVLAIVGISDFQSRLVFSEIYETREISEDFAAKKIVRSNELISNSLLADCISPYFNQGSNIFDGLKATDLVFGASKYLDLSTDHSGRIRIFIKGSA